MMTRANVWATNARTVVATIAAAFLSVLTMPSVAGAACQLPVGDIRDDRLADDGQVPQRARTTSSSG